MVTETTIDFIIKWASIAIIMVVVWRSRAPLWLKITAIILLPLFGGMIYEVIKRILIF